MQPYRTTGSLRTQQVSFNQNDRAARNLDASYSRSTEGISNRSSVLKCFLNTLFSQARNCAWENKIRLFHWMCEWSHVLERVSMSRGFIPSDWSCTRGYWESFQKTLGKNKILWCSFTQELLLRFSFNVLYSFQIWVSVEEWKRDFFCYSRFRFTRSEREDLWYESPVPCQKKVEFIKCFDFLYLESRKSILTHITRAPFLNRALITLVRCPRRNPSEINFWSLRRSEPKAKLECASFKSCATRCFGEEPTIKLLTQTLLWVQYQGVGSEEDGRESDNEGVNDEATFVKKDFDWTAGGKDLVAMTSTNSTYNVNCSVAVRV